LGSFRRFPPLALSDSELDAIMNACRPIAPERRDAFLHAVANALQGREVIGPGLIARVCAELQGEFF
jgi:hypothetical protein